MSPSAFLNSSGFNSVFEKLRSRDGLVCTIDLTVEIKLRSQLSPASVDAMLESHFQFDVLYA